MRRRTTAFVGATLLDGSGGRPRPDATVVVEGERIADVSDTRRFGPEVEVIDLAGHTLLPGLIDSHVHFASWAQHLVTHQVTPLMLLASETVRDLRTSLASGCTTARDLGGLERGFVDAVARGLIPGPRLQTAVVIISPTNGVLDRHPLLGAITAQGTYAVVPGMPTPWCDGPHQARAKVREALRSGATVVKIAMTGSITGGARPSFAPLFTLDELTAIVHEAHTDGVQVTCHAHGEPGAQMAVDAGVDTIEHGTLISERTLDTMAAKGTWLVPTCTIIRWHATRSPEAVRVRMHGVEERHRQTVALARQKGVRIAMGTDSNANHGFGMQALELELLVRCGIPPIEVIEIATRRSAECLGMDADVGTIAAGKLADLLVVDGDPLIDIALLQDASRIALVMQGGVPVSGTMVGAQELRPRERAVRIPVGAA